MFAFHPSKSMTKPFRYAATLYLLFVIYGSLVPFAYRELPFEIALNQLKNIRYLNLGMESRADWVANILLYIPLAFLISASFGHIHNLTKRLVLAFFVFVFCISIAFFIEFAQLYFPPRTVSINDLIAETLGTLLGIFIWNFLGQYFINLYQQISLGSLLSVKAAIISYTLIYLVLSFFPFDFVTSISELEIKLDSGLVNLFVSFDQENEDILKWLIKILVEMSILMPLGYLFCLVPRLSHKLLVTTLIGFFIGIFIESVQVFLVSGVAQGISVFTRTIGMGLGAVFYNWSKKQQLSEWIPRFRLLILVAILPYALLVFAINGGFSGAWLTSTEAINKLGQTNFIPLYYFYYTTETIALISLLSNLGTYLPIGLMYWFSAFSSPDRSKIHWFNVGLTASAFAIAIETEKLFLTDKHADPTDIFIAFAAASGIYSFMNRLQVWLTSNKDSTFLPAINQANPTVVKNETVKPNRYKAENYVIDQKTAIISIFIVIMVAWMLFYYPLGSAELTGFLVLYAYILWRYPPSWLFVLPALLPIMDFTLWTGWFFFDEFDLVILTTLAVYYWRKPQSPAKRSFSLVTTGLLTLFALCYFVSLLRGLLPLQTIDANAFSDYYSNYNSLRVGKGFIWALLLLPLLKQTFQQYQNAKDYFCYGILIGLSGVIVFAIIERMTFPGLFDFSTDYRINALFSTMHNGGGHIESYLALSLPFISVLFIESNHQPLKSLYGAGLFIAGLYVLLVTFSRGGYIGISIGFIVLMISLYMRYRNHLGKDSKPYLKALALIAIIPVIAIPILQGDLIQQRFNVAEKDKGIRENHWLGAIHMMEDDLLTQAFGMGLGSFPRTYFWSNSENSNPATYKIETENGNRFLSLRGGDWLYLGQYISVKPQTEYHLNLDLRGRKDKADLNLSICEKSVQYSFACSPLKIPSEGDEWVHIDQTINSVEVGSISSDKGTGFISRPVQLTLYNNGGIGKLIDVDNISLIDPEGKELISNGDFSKGTDRWFFSTEKHNPWHIFNIWVHVIFDMGWLGALSFVLLLIQAVHKLFVKHRIDIYPSVLLSSLSGFAIIGFVDSPFDAPRITLFFWLLVFFALIENPKISRRASANKN